MQKLTALLTAIFAIVIFTNCNLLSTENDPDSIAGEWTLVKMTEDICFCTGQPNCCGTITTPGEFEGCQLNLDGYFLFTQAGDNPNTGRLVVEQNLTSSCEKEPDNSEFSTTYYHHPSMNLLTLGGNEESLVLDATMTEDTLLLSYEDGNGTAYIRTELELRR